VTAPRASRIHPQPYGTKRNDRTRSNSRIFIHGHFLHTTPPPPPFSLQRRRFKLQTDSCQNKREVRKAGFAPRAPPFASLLLHHLLLLLRSSERAKEKRQEAEQTTNPTKGTRSATHESCGIQMATFTTTATTTATTTTNVLLCLLVIAGAPLVLQAVARLLGLGVGVAVDDVVLAPGKWIVRRLLRPLHVYVGRRQWRRRLLRRAGERLGVQEGRDEDRPIVARLMEPIVEGTMLHAEPGGPREEYVDFVRDVASTVATILSGGLSWLLSPDEAAIAAASASSSPVAAFGAVAARMILSTAVVVGLVRQIASPGPGPRRRFALAAAGLPVVLVGCAGAVFKMFAAHPTAREWAMHRGYCRIGPPPPLPQDPSIVAAAADISISNNNGHTCEANSSIETLGYLAALAVAMDQACLLLLLILLGAALNRLLFLSEIVASWWDGCGNHKKKKNATFARVHRIASRFDMIHIVDEQCCAVRDLSDGDPAELEVMAKTLFQWLGFRRNGAVWFGERLCVCNDRLPVPEPDARTGRVPTTTRFGGAGAGIALEHVGSVSMPFTEYLLHLYVAEPPRGRRNDDQAYPNDTLAAAAGMDTFFHLLALYECCHSGASDGFVQINKDRDFAGRFPVSRRGLAALVRDSTASHPPGGERVRHPRSRRSYDLDALGLAADQWDCIFGSCDGPNVQLRFNCFGYEEFPEAVRGLVSALQEDRCRASIFVIGLQSLPPLVLLEWLEALEKNRTVPEIAVSVEIRGGGDDDPADDTALLGLLGCLARRQARLDVLELRVPEFTQRTWDQLWTDVVPSRALNVRRLVLRTGPEHGRGRRTQDLAREGGQYVVDEGLMERTLCTSLGLCELDYRNSNMAHDDANAERIADRVRPYLNFNRFRRLLSSIEREPSAALRKRWCGSILIQSAATPSRHPNPAWCYHIVRRNAGSLLETDCSSFRVQDKR
jgi:hypothetical protein